VSDLTSGLDAKLVVERDDFTLDIELRIEPGETVALLGPNGSGKSTAVNALAGIIGLREGHVRFGDRTLTEVETGTAIAPEDRNVGVVFQDYLLFEHLSARDNIMFGLLATGHKKSDARAIADRWLDRLELSGLGDRQPSQLSGGQAQRIALARALANEPDLLLLDEPLAALDVRTRSQLRRVLGVHLAAFAGPRLLITHEPTDAFLLADRIAIMEHGRITQLGTSDDIRKRPATPYAAAVAGTNLLTGVNSSGTLSLTDHSHGLQTADTSIEGAVLITIHPTAIALHRERPSGSPRNAWETTIANVEPLGDTTRIVLADPLPLGVDITPGATRALNLRPGQAIWASVKATEVLISPSDHEFG